MMDSPSGTQGIDLLFKKLGHNIVEIRSRALESIVLKLDHGLLHEGDLVQEKQLMVRLLEWFNFDPSPQQSVVLQLLIRLTQHTSACDVLAAIGGLTFLSRLRPNLDPDTKPQCDVIIDRLLHVSEKDLSKASNENRRCVYGRDDQDNDPHDTTPQVDYPPMDYGYFTQRSITNDGNPPTPPLPTNEASRSIETPCLRFPGFLWHTLTGTDRHVLTSTCASLCSPSPHLVRNACAFLLDVIFRDFPAEIFLQRPSITQTLLTLISARPGGQLMTSSLECLRALAEGLISRLNFFQDPDMYCPRQGLPFHCESRNGSQGSRVNDSEGSRVASLTGSDIISRSEAEGSVRVERIGGDGRDHQSSSSGSTSHMSHNNSSNNSQGFNSLVWDSSIGDDNDVVALQRTQLNTPQFCIASLEATLPSLKTDSTRLALNIIQTISPIIQLLGKTIRADKLWIDASNVAQNIQSKLCGLLETLGDVLMYHYHMSDNTTQWTNKQWSIHEGRSHRVVFQTMAGFVVDVLQAVVPVEQANRVLKTSLSQALYVVAIDECMRLGYDDVTDIALKYLKETNHDKYEVVERLRKVVASFTHTHMLHHEYKELQQASDINLELIEIIESSLLGLDHRPHPTHITRVVHVISKVFHDNGTEDKIRTTSKLILLRLFAHPLVQVRRYTYEECLNIARMSVNVTSAAEHHGHTQSYACRFLLDSEVLYEVCTHGLADTSRLVSYPAQELISALLHGRVLMGEGVWGQLTGAMDRVLPVLQAFSGESEILCTTITTYIAQSHSNDTNALKSWVRGLMLKHRESRGVAANKLQRMFNIKISGLTDLLIMDTPLSLIPRDELDSFRIRRCIFQEGAVVRMLSVFRSSTTEPTTRIGALRQLSTMLEDPTLHPAFIQHNGLDSITHKLKQLSADDVTILIDDVRPAVSACITIMKLIMRHDAASRDKLSHDHGIIMRLIHLANLTRLITAMIHDVCVVLAMLVFHDVLREHVRTPNQPMQVVELSLPSAVVARYQIPFLCPSHHTVSIHRTLTHPPPTMHDEVATGPASSALRIGWNIAAHGNHVPTACNDATTNMDGDDNTMDFCLTESDRTMLVFSHPDTAADDLIDAIMTSQSHAAAIHIFLLLRIMTSSTHMSIKLTQSMFKLEGEGWKVAIGKFLKVPPSCYEDEVLLIHLVATLDDFLSITETTSTPTPLLQWMVAHISGSPLLKVLESSELQKEPVSSNVGDPVVSSVTIRRQLCKHILSLLTHVARLLHHWERNEEFVQFHREVRTVILVRLRLADAPQFYDLPSMEVTLQCLVHFSANQVPVDGGGGVIVVDMADKVLLQQLLGTLLEIVSAFHIGSGASSLSYMGKGVSRCSTQCILQLTREMALFDVQDWPSSLVYLSTNQASGLGWFVPLWSARDPRTRYAGLAVAAAVSQTRKGCSLLMKGFQHCAGGLWSMTLCVILDHSECSAVRGQAMDLLCNMTSHKFASHADVAGGDLWQGPVVQDETSDTTLYGIQALHVLLHHAHLYEHISLMLAKYYPNAYVRSPAYLNNMVVAATIESIQGSETCSTSTLTPLSQASISRDLSHNNNKEIFPPSLPRLTTLTHDTGTQVHGSESMTSSMTSSVTSLPAEWRSLVTPSLVTSLCRLLRNLVCLSTMDIVTSLVNQNILHTMNDLLDVERTNEQLMYGGGGVGGGATYHGVGLVTQHTWTTRLFHAVVASDANTAEIFTHPNQTFVANAVAALKIKSTDTKHSKLLEELHGSSLSFLTCLVHQDQRKFLHTSFTKEWHTIYEGTTTILNTNPRLKTSVLQLFALLFKSCDRNQGFGLVDIIQARRGETCDSRELTLMMINIMEMVVIQPSIGLHGEANHCFVAVCEGLGNLFACSSVSRGVAVEVGFFERCLQEIERFHEKLRLKFQTNNFNKESTITDDCESQIQPILSLTSLITNMISGNTGSKVHAASSMLAKIMTHLWSWTNNSNKMLVVLMELVATYTAHCEQACTSITTNHPGHPSVLSSVLQTCRDVQTLVLSRSKTKPGFIRLVFNILINVSISGECRALMWKTNLLELFPATADRGQHPKRSKQQTILLECWLSFMYALSFHTDGQLNILKLRDIFDVLVELFKSKTNAQLTLNIIRNLCFHSPSKNRISSNDSVVDVLLSNLDNKQTRMDSSIALLTLLCNNQKAKVHLKGAGLGKRVQHSLDKLSLEGWEGEEKYKRCLEDVLVIMTG